MDYVREPQRGVLVDFNRSVRSGWQRADKQRLGELDRSRTSHIEAANVEPFLDRDRRAGDGQSRRARTLRIAERKQTSNHHFAAFSFHNNDVERHKQELAMI